MSNENQWHEVVHRTAASSDAEVSLTELAPGDALRVVTRNAIYEFDLLEDRCAILRTDRADRPSGPVRIAGCAFGQSSSIKPDHLFCGGNLEFTFAAGKMTHRTSTIQALYVRQQRGG